MKNRILPLCCTALLLACSGCASSTGVMPWGSGLYSITVDQDKTLFTNLSDAEQKAYIEAANYCGSLGQDIEVQSTTRGSTHWHYNSKIVFRCIPRQGEAQSALPKQDVEMF